MLAREWGGGAAGQMFMAPGDPPAGRMRGEGGGAGTGVVGTPAETLRLDSTAAGAAAGGTPVAAVVLGTSEVLGGAGCGAFVTGAVVCGGAVVVVGAAVLVVGAGVAAVTA